MTRATLDPSLTLAGRSAPPLRVGAGVQDEAVHLVRVVDDRPARMSLCGTTLSGHAPRRLLLVSGCDDCADLALLAGFTYAEDRHRALVNLRRIPRRRSREEPDGARRPEEYDALLRDLPADPVPLIERILDQHEAAGADRLSALQAVLGTEQEDNQAWVERLSGPQSR